MTIDQPFAVVGMEPLPLFPIGVNVYVSLDDPMTIPPCPGIPPPSLASQYQILARKELSESPYFPGPEKNASKLKMCSFR